MYVCFTNGEKLCYLRNCLKDPITSDIVREAISNQEYFSVVEERLRKKMDKPKEVFRKAVSNVMNCGHSDYNKSSLYHNSTCVLKSLHTLERYGDESIYQLLTSILELKMSNKLRQEWACANGKSDAVPDIRNLIHFAEERHFL